MAIKDWPVDARPREKLLARGAGALTDAELLAIFLRTGVAGRSAVDLARDLIAQFGTLGRLLHTDQRAFCRAKGLGPAKYVQAQAVLEMARRALREELSSRPALDSPDTVREYLRLRLQALEREEFHVLYLDAQHRVLHDESLFQGSLRETSVYPREVVRRALLHNASAVILAHNHPSGVAEPSRADQALTAALRQALALVDIAVLDHFVVARGGLTSFLERGLL